MELPTNNQDGNTTTGQPETGDGDGAQKQKSVVGLNYFVILLGLILIGWCTYIIFIKQPQIDTFKQVFISVLLCLGCGLVATALSGDFKTGVLTVTGSVGITCFFLFSLMDKIQPNPVEEEDKKYRNFYQSFSNLSGIDLKLQVTDSLGKRFLEVDNAKEMSDYISELSYNPTTKELTYKFLIEDSTFQSEGKDILILLRKEVYNRIIDVDSIAQYNRDIWGNKRKTEYPEYVILNTPFDKTKKLTLTLIK